MEIARLHHAQITVGREQVEDARAFYLDALGFREIPKPDALVKRGGFWFEIGDQQVHVGVEDSVDWKATKAHLAYEVRGLAEWRGLLEARGIETSGNEPIPGYDRIEFRDPFGNRVEFIEPIVELVRPHGRARESFLAAVEECKPEGRYTEVNAENADLIIERMLLDTLYPDFFAYPVDDTERAAILLHEAKHLAGKDEHFAYEYVWRNRRKLGWTADNYDTSPVWQGVRKQTQDAVPELFACGNVDEGDCTK